MPGKDDAEEEREAQSECGEVTAEDAWFECQKEDESEAEGDAGGALGHQRDGEAQPEEPDAMAVVEVEFGETDESGAETEGEEGVHLADAGDVEEAEGGKQDDGAKPRSETAVAQSEPAVEKTNECDAGESGAEPRGELRDAEETEKDGSDPEHERRLFEPGLEIPVGDKKAGGEHLSGDLGVDAFVPVGEAVVAEQGEQDDGSEQGCECGGAKRGAGAVGLVRSRHGMTIRERIWRARVGEEHGGR